MKFTKIPLRKYQFLSILRITWEIVIGLLLVMLLSLSRPIEGLDFLIRFLILLNLIIIAYHVDTTIHGKPKRSF